MPPQAVKQYKRLVAEAGALFGSRHYRSYHFLLTLSDHVASFDFAGGGLECRTG